MKTERCYKLSPLKVFFIFYLVIKRFLKFVVDEFVFLADSPLHIALHMSRGGESIVECFILLPYLRHFAVLLCLANFHEVHM